MKDTEQTKAFVIVSPKGPYYTGLHVSEESAWTACFYWPSDEEIAERKAAGWYCAEATLTWKKQEAV